MEPRNSHFFGVWSNHVMQLYEYIYIYRIVASTNKKASPEKSCVICVQLPPESLAREDSCIYIYIYTILWLVVPFRPLYCCNMYYQHHHTQQQPVLNTACILRMHKNTSTKWGRVVWNYRISKSTRFSFFPSSNSLFTWRVGTNGSRVSLELRCQVRPGGSCLPQPTSRMWWSSPTPRRGPPFFLLHVPWGVAEKCDFWAGQHYWNMKQTVLHKLFVTMSTHLQEQLHLGSYMVISHVEV